MRKISSIALSLLLGSSLLASDAAMQEQIDMLKKEIESLKKGQEKSDALVANVQKSSAMDKVKFGIDFRNAYEMLDYQDNLNNTSAQNNSLLTSRFLLSMSASPMKGLAFKGKLAVYSTWGSHLYVDDVPLKDWSANSKADDTVMRIKEAYFVYKNKMGSQPYVFSIGRRPSSTGFLANMRENEEIEGSPLAHITNMEVNGAMLKLDWSRFIDGAYTKFVYGRAHTGDITNVYGTDSSSNFAWGPYASTESEDQDVDFFVLLGDAYNDKKHQIMYEWAHIFNTKGKNLATNANAVDAGVADLFALSYKINGLSEDKSSFLGKSIAFASIASTRYNAKSGYTLNGSSNGGTANGHSFWAGVNIPDMITEKGKIGFEYNYGSKHWTPMTWAEDTAIGSKIAVRGEAYEAYWNFDLFGVKYLPSQIRYTYAQHDYTPNVNCSGWLPVEEADLVAQNLRFFVSYRY
ncbi:DUF3373 domain-containing protein [Sulfurimonas crateris]|uniref:DUF3373 domain-containing protein n=1 Tax=Sulfurimonas crateris TaxID=2574727 RepID=A0A4U2Z7G0_9BACT|nr:DUF3373 family protein [Sulfurimonas crateris]TKI70208.1 DUF3373 domain-containing protein [Sulfurimonas crateris]